MNKELRVLLNHILKHYMISEDLFLSKRRYSELTSAKVVFALMAVKYITLDKNIIARFLNKDRNTVRHYLCVLKDEFSSDFKDFENIYLFKVENKNGNDLSINKIKFLISELQAELNSAQIKISKLNELINNI